MKITLKLMSEASFLDYLQHAIPAYAKDNVDAGRWQNSDSLERSKQDFKQLLPDGVNSKNNYLYNIIENNSSDKVGYIWVKIEDNIRNKSAFIYDIEIHQQYRRKGYAKSSLFCIEKIVAELGAINLGLHVFNNNPAALALYKSINYQVVSLNMHKAIKM